MNSEAPLFLVVLILTVVPALVSAAIAAHRMETAQRSLRSLAAENARLGGALGSLARRADVGLALFDEQGRLAVSNAAARRFSQLAGVRGACARYVFADDQVTPLPRDEQPLIRVLDGDVVNDSLLWVGPPGGQKALVVSGSPVTSDAGEHAGSFLEIQDVTAVIQASRDRESTLATLAHELRTPLTAILGYLDLIDLEDRPSEAAKIAVATRNAEHLLALTTRFLDGLRSPAEAHRVSISIAQLVSRALSDAASLPAYADRCVEVDLGRDAHVLVDPESIRRVLDNLLDNAVKFSEPQGTVRVATRVEASTLVVTVGNTGSPLSDHELERIFDRFYRGANAWSQAAPGAGLGLPISRGIAHQHGGTLTAAREGDQTVLVLRLPIEDSPRAAASGHTVPIGETPSPHRAGSNRRAAELSPPRATGISRWCV